MGSKARAEARHPERNRRDPDVMIAYVRDDWMVGMFGDKLMDTLLEDKLYNRVASRFSIATSRYVVGRNDICKRFLESGLTWLWMLDVDMTFHSSTLFNMLAVCEGNPEVKVLGGLCFVGGRTWNLEPTIYAENMNKRGDYHTVLQYPKDSLLRVGKTGAATLLIHRDVLVNIQEKHGEKAYIWFADEDRGGERAPGEDMIFCERARETGHEIYVHTGIRFGHMKMAPLFEWEFDHQQSMHPADRQLAELEFQRAMGLKT